MKAALLLALRVTTGTLLILWGSLKAFKPEAAIGVSDKYYSSAISEAALQAPLGWAQMALGALVILGLLRTFVYPIQALVLVGGALAIWQYLLDPFGLYLLEKSNLLFFPSSTVAIASLILIFFKSDDALSVDRLIGRG